MGSQVAGPTCRAPSSPVLAFNRAPSMFQSVLKMMHKRLDTLVKALVLLSLLAPLAGCVTSRTAAKQARAERARAVIGTRATYCNAPRAADKRVDVDRLIAQLVELHANTYSFCIHSHSTDWDDLKLILPRAREKGIRIWGSLVPPSESPPRTRMFAEPFRLDYERWAVEFAKLSLQETNLVAWSIDDFTHNLAKTYTPAYVKKMLDAAHQINPKLAFVPCCYFPTIKPAFVTNYCSLIDGILFPYRHESAKANLKDASLVEAEVKQIKELVGPSFPIVLDIYATAHSSLGATTPEYVEQAMIAGHHRGRWSDDLLPPGPGEQCREVSGHQAVVWPVGGRRGAQIIGGSSLSQLRGLQQPGHGQPVNGALDETRPERLSCPA